MRWNEADIFSICARVLSRHPTEITRATRLVEDLGASSLDLMQIAQSIEKEWGIVLSEDDLFLFNTAGDLVAATQAASTNCV
mgnify:CR=1 FL=1